MFVENGMHALHEQVYRQLRDTEKFCSHLNMQENFFPKRMLGWQYQSNESTKSIPLSFSAFFSVLCSFYRTQT